MLFNKFENRTIITGQLVAVDPVHIGSKNETLNPVNLDHPVLKDDMGNPVIPGSTVKGVVRSRFEAIMRSVGKEVCDIFDKNPRNCVSDNYIKEVAKKDRLSDYEKAEELYKKSCTACKLFGGKAIAGKLRFKDCTYIGERFAGEKRDGVGIDRDTGSVAGNHKYDFEIIPKDSRFDFMLIAENLDKEQEDYLKFIIALLEGSLIKGDYLAFGGKTTRGLGRMRLDNWTKEELTPDKIKNDLKKRFSI